MHLPAQAEGLEKDVVKCAETLGKMTLSIVTLRIRVRSGKRG